MTGSETVHTPGSGTNSGTRLGTLSSTLSANGTRTRKRKMAKRVSYRHHHRRIISNEQKISNAYTAPRAAPLAVPLAAPLTTSCSFFFGGGAAAGAGAGAAYRGQRSNLGLEIVIFLLQGSVVGFQSCDSRRIGPATVNGGEVVLKLQAAQHFLGLKIRKSQVARHIFFRQSNEHVSVDGVFAKLRCLSTETNVSKPHADFIDTVILGPWELWT
jgi:hypothetical protein